MTTIDQTFYDFYLEAVASSAIHANLANRKGSLEKTAEQVSETAIDCVRARNAITSTDFTASTTVAAAGGLTLFDHAFSWLIRSSLFTDQYLRSGGRIPSAALTTLANHAVEMVDRRAAYLGSGGVEDLFAAPAPAASVSRAAFTDVDVVLASRPTRAAYGGGQSRAVGHYASITWDASQDFAVECNVASHVAPSVTTIVLGSTGGSKWNILVLVDGAIVFREHVNTIASSPAGTIVFDGASKKVRVNVTGTTAAILVDGTSVATATFSEVTWASQNVYVGAANTTSQRWPGTIRDVRLIDNAVPANSVTLLLDEPSGPYRNTYPSSTAAAYATRIGTVESRLVNTPSGTGALVPSKAPARMRIAAHSGKADTALGAFASVSWAPSAGTAFRWKWMMSTRTAPSADVGIFGRTAANFANVRLTTAGLLVVRTSSTTLATSTVPVAFDGGTHEIEARFTDTTVELWIDGFKAINATVTAQSWSTTAAGNYLGAWSAAELAFPGTIWNFEIIDENSLAVNSAVYLLDEDPKVATTYANSLAGSSVGAMTRNGFVSCCPVVSHDGRGATWQPGAGGPWVYSAYATSHAALTGATSYICIAATGEVDPTGSYNAATGAWTAPADGDLELTFCGTLRLTTLVSALSSPPYARIVINGVAVSRGFFFYDAAGQNLNFCVHWRGAVTAGQIAYGGIGDTDATDTFSFRDFTRVTFAFTPNVATG